MRYLVSWCWEGLGTGGEGDNRGWDGWMASPTQWTWVWVNSRSWWWTGRPGVLRFMGSQRVGHDWATELLNTVDSLVLFFHVPKVKGLGPQLCLTLYNPMDWSPPGSLSMEFSRQEYWSGYPFPSPGDLSDPRIKPGSPALQADS